MEFVVWWGFARWNIVESVNVVRLSYGVFVTGHVICTTPTSPPPPLALAQAVYSCTFPTFCLGTVGTLRPIARLENYLPRVKGRPPVLGLKPTFFRNGVISIFNFHFSFLRRIGLPLLTFNCLFLWRIDLAPQHIHFILLFLWRIDLPYQHIQFSLIHFFKGSEYAVIHFFKRIDLVFLISKSIIFGN